MLRERRRHANFKPNRKLDRKSSRGMIYENEELRLRTININAEVERGQSDIKKLRRENDQLRKEIWSLRDEYDRLDKLLRANKTEQQQRRQNNEDNKCDSCNQSEDSNSCDTCNEDEDDDDDDDDVDDALRENVNAIDENDRNARVATYGSGSMKPQREKLHVNFDHLSIVSEETTLTQSGGDDGEADDETDCIPISATALNDDFVPDICAALYDFQSIVPSLSHFENLCYEDIGPNLDSSGQVRYAGDSSTTTGETQIPAKEWDFNSGTLRNPVAVIDATSTSPIIGRTGPADLCVQNALATNMSTEPKPNVPHYAEPIYAQIHKNSRTCSPSAFPTGGNLDDLLLDIEHLSNDIAQMQLENQRHCRSQYDLHHVYADDDAVFSNNDGYETIPVARLPYRSEMNLLLSFDGAVPTITTIPPTFGSEATLAPSQTPPTLPVTHLEGDTPPPAVPEPMFLLPNTLPYIEFKDTRLPLSALNGTLPPPPPPPPPAATTLQRKGNNLQTIRRKLFARKPVKPPTDGTDQRCETHSSSSEPAAEKLLNAAIEPPPEAKRSKSRRVSIYFNGSKRNTANEEKATKLVTELNSKVNRRRDSNSAAIEPTAESTTTPTVSTLSNGTTASTSQPTSATPQTSQAASAKAKKPQHHHHHHRKMSEDSTRRSSRLKNRAARRHSDGGGISGTGNGDDTGAAGTSMSERNSNSAASSRDSSTSLSTRSQKSRKISIGSHGGGAGKIPWCACWGNGCI